MIKEKRKESQAKINAHMKHRGTVAAPSFVKKLTMAKAIKTIKEQYDVNEHGQRMTIANMNKRMTFFNGKDMQ